MFYLFFMIPMSLVLEWTTCVYFFFFFFFFFFCKCLFLDWMFFSYFFFFDKISYVFCCLSIWICILMIYSMINYMGMMGFKYFIFYVNMLLFMLFITFVVNDFFYFYFFFEGSLIPVFLIIFGWGYQPERLMAGYYLIFYTLFASFPFLLVILDEINLIGKFSYFFDYKIDSMFKCFFIIFSFLIKFPLFGLHNWLPKAHVEAPVSGSMILAGLLLKMGGYGILRSLKFIYFFMFKYNYFFIMLSLYGCILISLFCLIQSDMKMLIAYSSICHMGMVISGLFTITEWGILGSLIFMIGHGLVSSGLFFLIGILFNILSSRSLFLVSGVINFLPSLSLFWFLLSVMNMSCPPSINLFSEVCISFGLMSWDYKIFMFLLFIFFFSACYSLTFFFMINHGNFSRNLKLVGICFVLTPFFFFFFFSLQIYMNIVNIF
uniref:NADH dehydrogenase subunit 4 n=1 Tax=Klapperibrachys cremeri TaxID=3081117 RepID=UPI002A801297|nr:NADH dehydrogenase subunit 4 [Klapperibrachys cremeri]WOW99082.1 NADH dehydrogenase subunit 4 [Klapperibrachys cremeri]